MTLKELLAARQLRYDAAGLVAGKDKGTISRIATGRSRAQPETVVALARGLGISARRMQAICDESWRTANPDERVPA